MSRPFFFGGNQTAQQSQYLVQFKAGKMVRNGNTVSPVKEKKGMVYLHQSADDNLMHFCWKDRTSGEVEDDLIIFPDDAEFLKVPQCTTGRVFVLKFKTSPRRLFFWSQEPKDDKDEDYVSKINEYINNPMAAMRNSAGSHVGLMNSNEMSGLNSDEELRNLFNNSNFSAQQLMSMLDGGLALLPHGGGGRLATLLNSAGAGSGGGSSTTGGARPPQPALTTTASSTPAAPQTPSTTPAQANSSNSSASESSSTTGGTNSPAGIRLADLQNIISGLTQAGQQQQHLSAGSGMDVNVDLSTSINYDVLKPLLSNEDFLKRVTDMLPKTDNDPPAPLPEQVESNLRSPQFQQALSTFSTALQSGQLGPLVQQFGLHEDCVRAANAGNLEAFVKALQKHQQKSPDSTSKATTPTKKAPEDNSKPPGPPEKNDKPDDMSLD